jgi:hypothetical protein
MENLRQDISRHNNLTDNNPEQIKYNGSANDDFSFDAEKDFCKRAVFEKGVHFILGN